MNFIEEKNFLPFDMCIINYTKEYIDLLELFGWNKFPKTPLHCGQETKKGKTFCLV